MNNQEKIPGQFEVKEDFSLKEFLTYQNPDMSRYRSLIKFAREESRWRQPQDFASEWSKILYDRFYTKPGKLEYDPPTYEKAREYFREKLQGQILVDLGGGYRAEVIRELAKKSGVRIYINVDMCHGKNLDPYKSLPAVKIDYSGLPEDERGREMEELFVADDMLDFLARLPDNSCNFSINGIDHWVLGNERSATGYEYSSAVYNEVMRTTKRGGIMFGAGSDIWQENPNLKFKAYELGLQIDETIDWSGYGAGFIVFEKS